MTIYPAFDGSVERQNFIIYNQLYDKVEIDMSTTELYTRLRIGLADIKDQADYERSTYVNTVSGYPGSAALHNGSEGAWYQVDEVEYDFSITSTDTYRFGLWSCLLAAPSSAPFLSPLGNSEPRDLSLVSVGAGSTFNSSEFLGMQFIGGNGSSTAGDKIQNGHIGRYKGSFKPWELKAAGFDRETWQSPQRTVGNSGLYNYNNHQEPGLELRLSLSAAFGDSAAGIVDFLVVGYVKTTGTYYRTV